MRAALGVAAPCLSHARRSEARAEDASPWQRDAHSAVRLLAGSRSGAVLLGGIAIQLQPGWKTYWRTPGDSGVPPRFDFSKSENVEAVTVLWPAPMKFDDGAGGTSLGYKQQVVLPLRIVAKNADKPVTLRADDQLRGLRKDLHSRRCQCRARLRQRGEHRGRRVYRRRSTPCRSRPISAIPIRSPSVTSSATGKSNVMVDVPRPRPRTSACSSRGRRRTGRCRFRSWWSTPARRETLYLRSRRLAAGRQSRKAPRSS